MFKKLIIFSESSFGGFAGLTCFIYPILKKTNEGIKEAAKKT